MDRDLLLKEANRVNYRLRSTFFYRKLKEYNTLAFPLMVANLFSVEHLYHWEDRGSWGIGEEAEKVVQRLLIKETKDRNLLAALIPRVSTAVEPYDPARLEEQPGNIERYRGIMQTNKTSMLFSSDPDISLLNTQGATVAAIEVKGGADPAGALERYGAAKKSFEEVRRSAPEVTTILVASCITAEVDARIRQDSTISSYYNLTEILSEDSSYATKFMQEVFSLLGASDT